MGYSYLNSDLYFMNYDYGLNSIDRFLKLVCYNYHIR